MAKPKNETWTVADCDNNNDDNDDIGDDSGRAIMNGVSSRREPEMRDGRRRNYEGRGK
jgi:hypothetical protein